MDIIVVKEVVKVSDVYMPTDKQYDGQLIDEYSNLMKIRESAKKEGAVETVKVIDHELRRILLKLKPIVMPVPEDWDSEK